MTSIFQARPWISLQNHRQTCSSCHKAPNLYSCSYPKHPISYGSKQTRRDRGARVKGCCCACGGHGRYSISEEDKRFVEVVREAQPYVRLHSGTTFVVVLSGEVADSPYLDNILKTSSPIFLVLELESMSWEAH